MISTFGPAETIASFILFQNVIETKSKMLLRQKLAVVVKSDRECALISIRAGKSIGISDAGAHHRELIPGISGR